LRLDRRPAAAAPAGFCRALLALCDAAHADAVPPAQALGASYDHDIKELGQLLDTYCYKYCGNTKAKGGVNHARFADVRV
jgi:hypothetical protein